MSSLRTSGRSAGTQPTQQSSASEKDPAAHSEQRVRARAGLALTALNITAFRENHQGQDRRDAGQRAEPLEVRSVLEQRVGAGLQGLPQLGTAV